MSIDGITGFLMAGLTGMAGYVAVKFDRAMQRADTVIDRNTQAFVKVMTYLEKKK